MRYGDTVTRTKTLETPPLHDTLKALSNASTLVNLRIDDSIELRTSSQQRQPIAPARSVSQTMLSLHG